MKAIYLNVYENKESEIIEFKDDLDTFYKLIQCSTIDIVQRKLGNKYYNIICDDEGALIDSPKISAVNNLGDAMLVGNLIIVGDANEDGDLLGIEDNEAKNLLQYFQKVNTRKYTEGYTMLTNCEY